MGKKHGLSFSAKRTFGIPVAALGVLLLTTAFPLGAVGQEAPRSHIGLDWKAPNLWVHVDNVDAQKAGRFESARKHWLQALRRGDELLGDGRPLFWHARSSRAGQTFFTFYPFGAWADLEARRQMVARTQETVGDSAVKAYDSGDEALVTPHYSQIWRRAGDYDIAGAATQQLTELTAAVGRLEVHSVDIRRWDDFERAWRQIAEALGARKYPLACRAFRSTYGRGEFMTWWMAPDSATYKGAPPLRAVLDQQLGKQASAELLATLKKVFPLEESYEIERRPDLSNLGRVVIEPGTQTASKGSIDTVLVRSIDLTCDGKPDTVSLHLMAKSLSSPFSWTLSIRSQGNLLYSYSGEDSRIDTFFHDKMYLPGCNDYLECKKKYYFHDILANLETRYNLEDVLDRTHSNTLYAIGGAYLLSCCALKGAAADSILSGIEERLRHGAAVVISIHTSPETSEPPMTFAPEVNRFVPIYQE